MLYQTRLVIPASTPIGSPVESEVVLTQGVVSQVEIMFPPGSCGLAKVAIFHKEHRLWPSSPEEWFYADDYPFKWPEDFAVDEQPFLLRVEGYNEDILYPHEVICRFAMLSNTSTLNAYFTKLLGPYQLG